MPGIIAAFKNMDLADLSNRLGLPLFCADLKFNLGYDQCLLNRGIDEDSEFFTLEANIPKARKMKDSPCPECKGFKTEGECSACMETGKETYFDWKMTGAILASLSLFLELLIVPPEGLVSRKSQLMQINMTPGKPYGFNANISGSLRDFLRYSTEINCQSRPRVLEMLNAMKDAWRASIDLNHNEEQDFYMEIEKGVFWLKCQGDARDLTPDSEGDRNPKQNNGYHLTEHNLWWHPQRLAFLAAFAALHDKARGEME